MARWILLSMIALFSHSYAGEIADLYKHTYISEKGDVELQIDKQLSVHSITEIGLERTQCYGICPVYSVIFRNDGSVSYTGEKNVELIGRRKGRVPIVRFDLLASFIVKSGYMDLEHRYSAPVSDHPTVYTTVVKNGKRKIISNYANSGPINLWAIEQLIDKLLSDVTWEGGRTN